MNTRYTKGQKWQGKTTIDLQAKETENGKPILEIRTACDYYGRLETTALVCYEKNGSVMFRIGAGDFYKKIAIHSEVKRVTEKAVKEKHEAALISIESLKTEAESHLAARAA